METKRGARTGRRFGRSKRAVSDLIAEIMVIAMTVTLAGLLAVMVAGYSHSTNAPSLGYSLAISPSTSGYAGTTYYYNFSTTYASGLTLSNLAFELRAPNQATLPPTGIGLEAMAVGPHGLSPLATYSWSSEGWQAVPGGPADPGTSAWTTMDLIALTSPTSLAGDQLVALGENGFSGAVSAPMPSS
jgi:flagellin-like protein